jgi:hypothetical protein
MELYRSRFSHLPLEEFRSKIVNETDAALIEQWKAEASRQKEYRTKKEAEVVSFRRRAEADSHFMEHYAPAMIQEGRRFIVPGAVVRATEDPALLEWIRDSLDRECRFPLKMAVAIHPAFRHMGMHIFKTPGKITFVSAIQPNAIDPAKTTDLVRTILEWLANNPGSTRQGLVESLRPGAAPDSPEVAELLGQMRWLVDKGHVIEFFNGTLAIPGRKPVRPAEPAAEPASEPAAEQAPAEADAAAEPGEAESPAPEVTSDGAAST